MTFPDRGPVRYIDLGDSWNAGYDDRKAADTGGWLALLPGPGVRPGFVPVKHMSVSGSSAAQWAMDFGGRLSDAAARAGDTDVYFVSLLGNDAFAALRPDSPGGPLVTPEERERAVADIRKVVSTLHATGKRVLVMLYANPYPGNIGLDVACAALNSTIVFAVGDLVAPDDYIQAFTVLKSPESWSGIGVHPSPAGYAALASYVETLFL